MKDVAVGVPYDVLSLFRFVVKQLSLGRVVSVAVTKAGSSTEICKYRNNFIMLLTWHINIM